MNLDRIIAEGNKKTIYQDQAKIVKVFDQSYSKTDVFREVFNHTSVEDISVKVPKLLEVTNVDGKWAIVCEFAGEKTLQNLIDENPSKKEEYLEVLVNVQNKIFENESTQLNGLKEVLHDKIRLTNFSATTRYALHNNIDAMPRSYTVCHGNLNPSNVIVADNGEIYVIGWAHATSGYSIADVAKTYLLLLLEDSKETAEKYLEIFLNGASVEKADIDKVIAVIAATEIINYSDNKKEILLSLVNEEY